MALSASAAKRLALALPTSSTGGATAAIAVKADFIRAYWEAVSGGARDKNGNVLYEGTGGQPMRLHFDGLTKGVRAEVQFQTKGGGTWKTLQRVPVWRYFDAAAEDVAKKGGLPSTEERAAAERAEQERKAAEIAETRKIAGVLALKHAAAGMTLNDLAVAFDAEEFDTDHPEYAFVGDLTHLTDRYASALRSGMTVSDDVFGSVDRPPLLPMFTAVPYSFVGKVDGVQAMVNITHATEYEAQVAALCGDAVVKGTVRIESWGLAGRLTAVTGKGPSVGRAVALWCKVLRGYGVAVWEVEPKLKATVAKLPEVMLATEGHRVLGRCVGAGFQLGLPGMRPNR